MVSPEASASFSVSTNHSVSTEVNLPGSEAQDQTVLYWEKLGAPQVLEVRHKGRNGIKTEGCYVRKEAEMEDGGGKSRGLVSGRAEALERWDWSRGSHLEHQSGAWTNSLGS